MHALIRFFYRAPHSLLMLVTLFFTFVATKADTTQGPLPVETFFGETDMRGAQLSPDGRHLAFLTTLGWGKVGVALLDLVNPGKPPEALVSAKDENIKTFAWKGSDYIVYAGDIGGDESYAWRVIPVAPPKNGGKRTVRVLSESSSHTIDYLQILDALKYDPERMLITGIREPGSRTISIFTLNVRTGQRNPITSYDPPPADTDTEDIADNHGVLRARRIIQNDRVIYEVRPEPESRYTKIAEFPANKGDIPWSFLFFGADNETLYLLSTEHSDTNTLYTYNVRTGRFSEPLFHSDEGDITAVHLSWDRTKLYGVTYETDKLHHKFFDAGREKLHQTIDNSLPPGTENSIISSSSDEKVLVIAAHSDRDPGTYYLLDLQHGRMSVIGRAMHSIDAKAMRSMEAVQFQARDGLTIHGYLTRPASAEKGPVPLILNPHGGPYGVRDERGFNPEIQLLANHGYAVLQVNYRGSGGYGVKFQQAGYHEWGGKMQDDLTDAVKWAVAQHITTADQVAIYGASYGGYATLAGLTFTPELYRCGINYVGPSDMLIQISDYKISRDAFARLFASQRVGDGNAFLHDRSPVNFVERIRVPLLNAYGYNDPRVNIKQWEVLEPKLKQFGKSYEIRIEKNEGHGFHNESNRIAFYKAVEAFLGKYMPTPEIQLSLAAASKN